MSLVEWSTTTLVCTLQNIQLVQYPYPEGQVKLTQIWKKKLYLQLYCLTFKQHKKTKINFRTTQHLNGNGTLTAQGTVYFCRLRLLPHSRLPPTEFLPAVARLLRQVTKKTHDAVIFGPQSSLPLEVAILNFL